MDVRTANSKGGCLSVIAKWIFYCALYGDCGIVSKSNSRVHLYASITVAEYVYT